MSRYREGNAVQLLESGAEYFPALEAAIDQARTDIHIEVYIFADDATGRRIAVSLIRAARRGVEVRVLIDGFGTKDYLGDIVEDLREAGVQVLIYRQELSGVSFRRNRLRRLHRKVSVIDGRIAFVGGINLIDDFNTPRHMPPRFDYAVRVEGPMLGDIYPVVRRLWWIVRASQLRYRRGRPDSLASNQGRAGTVRAAFVFRDNLYHRRDIEQEYLRALAEAKDEAIIANAYFFPGREFRHALVDAARRGVRVSLLLQGKVEYFLLHYATRALYGTLLNAGVEIIEYHKSFLHAKVAVIDGEWATVGSSNIDPFSLLLAREANVFVRDKDFAGQLRESLQRAMELGATPVVRQMWRGRSWPERALTWVCYGAARLLMGLVGYGKRWDA